MNLLVGIKSIQGWLAPKKQSHKRPRLPLPYTFSEAFHYRNHKIFAIVSSNESIPTEPVSPFERIYPQNELLHALRNTDLALFWGGRGFPAILRQVLLSHPRRRVIFCSYIWQLSKLPSLKTKLSGITARICANFSKGLVVMTDEQLVLAKQVLPSSIPVIRFICGIDTCFYKIKANYSDIPQIHRPSVDKLLAKPYVIMLGDQQRCNEDTLKLVKHSDINLVRVCREKKTMLWFNKSIQRHKLNDRLFIFRDISHVFLRFLLQHASAYWGLVDSSWQPAGWTAACEALASGLPVVIYEGLVSRELTRLGGGGKILQHIPSKDIKSFQSKLESMRHEISKNARDFAANNLDIEKTSTDFVRQIETLINNPST